LHVRTGRFGLVFVDYNMPGFDGIETLKEIRRHKQEVAVVLMTQLECRPRRARACGRRLRVFEKAVLTLPISTRSWSAISG
jgi:CheY-like chemotaxis protein